MYLSIYHYLSTHLPIYLSTYLPTYLPIYLSLPLSVCLSVYLSTCLSASLKTKQVSEPSSIFELNNVKNETILRDFCSFWTWQHPKRSNSARLLHFLNMTTSKTKQFCETSFKNRKLSAALTASYQCVLWFFPLHLSKVLRLPRRSDARRYEVLHLSREIISANLKIWCSKMQPLSGNQRPDLLTSLMNMSFVLRLPRKMHLCRSSSHVPRLPWFLEMRQNPHVLLTFDKVRNPLRLPRETTSEPPKVVRACGALYILTWKYASRHNGVHFFDISTSKSGPTLVCFVHFDFEMGFAPKRRALFRHLNCQKWSENGVLCTFWLPHGLRATTACTLSTSQLPKAVRTWGVFSFFTYKCASRHNGVHFFISHLARWLRTRRFSEPTFRPSGATNHWKTQCFATFLPFRASASSFFWLFLFSDLLSSTLLFSLPLPSSAFHLSICHIVGRLTSKLPSTNYKLQITLQIALHYKLHCVTNYITLPSTLHYKLHFITNDVTLQITLHYKLHYIAYIHSYIYMCVYTRIFMYKQTVKLVWFVRYLKTIRDLSASTMQLLIHSNRHEKATLTIADSCGMWGANFATPWKI